MEGYLPPAWSIAWGALCIPFVVAGSSPLKGRSWQFKNASAAGHVRCLCLCAFGLEAAVRHGQLLHPTGVGLGAVSSARPATSVPGVIVLLFQAILLAHGGLTTWAPTRFPMGIAGPFAAFGIYQLFKKLKAPAAVAVFLAAFIGDLFYICGEPPFSWPRPSLIRSAGA
jgi:cobalt/nickel transport system permease protein